MKRPRSLISLSCARAVMVLTALTRFALPLAAGASARDGARRAATGPLSVHPDNPRYFADASGKAVYLTGSHTWASLQDTLPVGGRSTSFDYAAYLDFLEKHNHNFFRLWAWESTTWVSKDSRNALISPLPFARAGPGKALDGKPKFDVTRFNQAYFDRLRARVEAAQDHGCYVAVMLFQGFSVARKSRRRKGTPWTGHPLNKSNNRNGVDGDTDGDGDGYEAHTLGNPAVTRVQEAYVRKVIDMVNDLDNVIYEISNESHGDSTEWQYHFVRFIHEHEKHKPKQHPVWMSFQWDGIAGPGSNRNLWKSPAEAVSPARDDRDKSLHPYRGDPPATNAGKVVLCDTDHIWGVGGNVAWVWKSLTRGLQPIFMEPYKNSLWNPSANIEAKWDPVRRAMGHSLVLANRMDLAAMTPQDNLASTRYCLANPGREYLVYLPSGGEISMDLSATEELLAVEWFDPRRGKTIEAAGVRGGQQRTLTAPFAGHAVLYLVLAGSQQD
ncbi:MAG: hypothetical protein HN742_30715 [Lentisphaerae bacterium]|nr:hypothetical protein [Lentisphaerota bacterium]MBT4820476.1 hypothetical protein [Lentisphaerota bacterium]MBT5606322.1 hypothetical protein [Lentisphaerota bacterium]MBT7059602.1 hypothetical protein [Lentisphaerota bacterium]MBT7846284.1 hypothetical protein [Lentisphaerota bacterium]